MTIARDLFPELGGSPAAPKMATLETDHTGNLTPDRILAYWNATVTQPYRQATMTPKRWKQLRARMRDHPSWSTWKNGIDAIEASLFARGLKGWRCTFRALCERRDLIVKAGEGEYAWSPGRAPVLEGHARRLRKAHGGCDHDPRCNTEAECILAIVWGLFDDGRREPDNRRARTRFQTTGGR